jgi:hypothetical protein
MMSGAPRAPYALEPTVFPLPALAAMAGRAPLGGPREIVLACLMVARIVIDATATDGVLTDEQKRARADEAAQWLAATAIPTPVRTALIELAEAAAGADRGESRAALDSVMTVTANYLDPGARLELGRLAQAIAR